MAQYVTKPTTVDAIQFDGSEESASAAIAWANAIVDGPKIHRHQYKGSWNDQTPELWLRVDFLGNEDFVAPGNWVVIHDDDAHVLPDHLFREDYEEIDT